MEEKQRPKELNQGAFLDALKGQEVMVAFLDGKAMHGVLLGNDRYNLFIRQQSGLEIMICKHALKYVHATKAE